MIRLSGLLVTHQCEQFDYCFRESLNSLIDTCDEVVVVDGRSTDGTREVLSGYEKDRGVKVIDADWNPVPGTNGQWLSDLYNLAKANSSGLWNIGLQADEVLHEIDRDEIRRWARNTSLRRINFWRDPQHFVPGGKVCGNRVSRFGSHVDFVGDAECRSLEVPWDSSDVCIFHYGFLRKTESLIAKCISLEESVFGTHNPLFETMEKAGRLPFDNYHSDLMEYRGPHPKYAYFWLEDRGYDSGRYIAARPICQFIKAEWTGVEIGVFMADSSQMMLRHCQFLYLIDPCEPYEGNPDNDYFSIEEGIHKKLERSTGRYEFIRGLSHEVHDRIPEVDFAFIDGNHTYEYVSRDIGIYWLHVRRGGLISGHDYGSGFPGVVQAVTEFSLEIKLPVEIHGDCWLIRKP